MKKNTQQHIEDLEQVVSESEQAPIDDASEQLEIESCEECAQWKQRALRALADYQNLQNRSASERARVYNAAKQEVFVDLLPFLDNLDQAEVFIKDPGLNMIRDQFLKSLEQSGLQTLEVVGKEFDPHTAEAIELVDSDKDNIVVEQLVRGFRVSDQVIRPAKVKVGRVSK